MVRIDSTQQELWGVEPNHVKRLAPILPQKGTVEAAISCGGLRKTPNGTNTSAQIASPMVVKKLHTLNATKTEKEEIE